jgi:hypothetical protein
MRKGALDLCANKFLAFAIGRCHRRGVALSVDLQSSLKVTQCDLARTAYEVG